MVKEETPFKDFFSIFSSGCHFVQRSRMDCTILVMGIMRNIHVKLFQTWTCCFDVLLFFSSGGHFV